MQSARALAPSAALAAQGGTSSALRSRVHAAAVCARASRASPASAQLHAARPAAQRVGASRGAGGRRRACRGAARVVAAAGGGEDYYAVLGVDKNADGAWDASRCVRVRARKPRAQARSFEVLCSRATLLSCSQGAEGRVPQAGAQVPPRRQQSGACPPRVRRSKGVAKHPLTRAAHPQPDATDRFRKIKAAYTTLSDPAARSQYDRRSQGACRRDAVSFVRQAQPALTLTPCVAQGARLHGAAAAAARPAAVVAAASTSTLDRMVALLARAAPQMSSTAWATFSGTWTRRFRALRCV